ncbi:SDR family oxidoreductase [Litorivicinus sp.]|nr:SDR family oxidoreductase [Litorivicinus sp.]
MTDFKFADMSGRRVLLTGAGPNIGRQIAVTLAKAGAEVALNDINPDSLKGTVVAVEAAGGKAYGVVADVSDPKAVQAMLDEISTKFGPVDGLVNNAAITIRQGVLDSTYEDWMRVLNITLTSVFLVGQAFMRQMISNDVKKGSIVNIASTSAHRGRHNAAAYCSAKAGVLNLTRCMAVEFAPYGVRVNSVTPTRSGNPVGESTGSREPVGIPLGRLGEPQDQANAVLFALSHDAAFITGIDIPVDGGTLCTASGLSGAKKPG